MPKKTDSAVSAIECTIEEEVDSLSHTEYREVLEEVLSGIEMRLEAHKEEHPEIE